MNNTSTKHTKNTKIGGTSMADTKKIIRIEKKHVLIVIYIPILYMLVVCAFAFIRVPIFQQMFENLGLAELPFITRFMLATYRYWVIVPILLSIATVYCALRSNWKAWQAVLLFGTALVLAFGLYAILNEGTLSPLLKIIEMI